MRSSYVSTGNVEPWLEGLLGRLQGTRCRAPLPGMSEAALVMLDLQRVFVDPSSPAYLPAWEALGTRAQRLVAGFRAARLPVIWTRHVHCPGDDGGTIGRHFGRLLTESDPLSRMASAHQPAPDEPCLDKDRHSAFARSDLEARLRRTGTRVVVLAGVQAHLCVLATAVEAGSVDLLPVVAADAVAAPTGELHEAALAALSGGLAWIATTAEILGALEER